jgi:hypothetical protein
VRKNKKLGIAAWLLGLALANILLFCLSHGLTPTFWITFCFVWIAFLSVLIFQLFIWKRMTPADAQALYLSALLVSYVYLVVQIPICVIFALGSSIIPWKAALLIQAVLLILAWIVAIGSLAGNDHIRDVNNRQRNPRTEK